MSAIKIKDLTKYFNVGLKVSNIQALSGLNLEVAPGEVFGFLGPNGAGKTTTIKILMGLIYPSSGAAWIFDRPVGDIEIKRRIGFLPEQPYFYDYLTGEEFLQFYGRLFGLEPSLLRGRIDLLLERVGIAHARNVQLRRYSKGMLQRIGIAQALINEPDLVVLDEPMSGLDPVGRKEVRDIILQLREEGKTVFFSTHIIPDVEVLCDRVAILLKGRLVHLGMLNDILETRLKQVEIVAQGDCNRLAQDLQMFGSLLRRGDQVVLTLRDEFQVDDVIDRIREAKGRVISITPQRETLEEHFMKLAGS